MMREKILLLVIVFFTGSGAMMGQTCSVLGQTPQTAFPVCGTQVFEQSQVNFCGNRAVPAPCSADQVTDKNPFWYKFTCFQSGTLGFEIVPNNLIDDYDWQLFDVTNTTPDKIYTDASLFVACNWSGESGKTGSSTAGSSLTVCAGMGKDLYSKMPALEKDHQYLLLISHFTDTQSGYQLSFGGGTANITDPKEPHLQSASANCEANEITVVLNKKMKCASLAADGSDFEILGGQSLPVSARSSSCSASFDIDSLVIQLDKPLAAGNYEVSVKNGSDANTLFDNCARNIPADDKINLTILPIRPTPMDSLVPVSCSPGSLRLVFSKKIRCASIAANGSDFTVTGDYPVSVIGALASCENGLTNIIDVQLSAQMATGGSFQLILKTGSDGSTLIDECGEETLPASLSFALRDTVSADFNYQVIKGCKTDEVQFSHPGLNAVNRWNWQFNNSPFDFSTKKNPSVTYTSSGEKPVTLITTNGFCADTASAVITLNAKMKVDFDAPDILCAIDKAIFADKSFGDILSWNWDFGNQTTSRQSEPSPVTYTLSNIEKKYPVSLIVTGRDGCSDTLVKQVLVVGNCFITVPTAFTPNNDGLNDYLFPSNAYKAVNLVFKIYNRYGQVMFQTKDWTRKWDGSLNGRAQDAGVYVWTLTYLNKDSGKWSSQKGTTVLIR